MMMMMMMFNFVLYKKISVFEKKRPKFEGVLEVNTILTKTQKLYEGELIGPESIAVDSTGS